MRDFIFTSESVTPGHPDKLCDQISDAIVDQLLQEDPRSRVNAECAAASGILFLAVQHASDTEPDVAGTARRVIARVGYDHGPFDAQHCSIMTNLSRMDREQNPSLLDNLDKGDIDRFTARNQVTVFGFACTQTPALMPLPLWSAHMLARRLAAARTDGIEGLSPDGKTQVAVEYRDRRPSRIHSLSVNIALELELRPEQLREALIEKVIGPAFADAPIQPDDRTRIYVNPEGPFVGGGPAAHAGLTGRKNAIDTYGEYARQSGAALSGKDIGRIDRTGAYAARHAARNVVAAGLADECEVQLSYTVGLSRPVSIGVETFATGKVADEEIARRLDRSFDFRPAAIAAAFELPQLSQRPSGFFARLATYGHMGRVDLDLPWEKDDKVDALTQ